MEYSWCYPVFMEIKYQGKQHRIQSCEEALEKMKEHGIVNKKQFQQEMKLEINGH